jgi:hypothetical protein
MNCILENGGVQEKKDRHSEPACGIETPDRRMYATAASRNASQRGKREHDMKRVLMSAAFAVAATGIASAVDFDKPVRLKAGTELIRVEAPGYAFPGLADIDRDGKLDLLVGQFNKGKIRVHKGLGEMKFAAGEWLKAEGDVAEVPGVW